MIFDVNGLSFAYRSEDVLSDVSFTVNSGEILTILGPNGVGKTTLLKCLNRIVKKRSGTIMIDGIDICGLRIKEMAKNIGYVPQRAHVSGSTVFESVLLGRKPHMGWDVSEKDLRLTGIVIDALGLTPISEKKVNGISGGEYQLVQIARAIVQEPSVILLDEPTNNLDLNNQNRILRILSSVVKDNGLCAVMTNHDLNLSIRYSDRFVFMKDGGVYSAGGMEVITPETIESVYGMEVYVENVKGILTVIPK